MSVDIANIIPFGEYKIDSGKFFIDKDLFKSVNIPDHFLLSDADTGEVIGDFKKSSFEVPYKTHKIYLANVCKTLGNQHQDRFVVEKVMIYFPAKVFGDKYFQGITIEGMVEVLEYIKSKGYLDFDSVEDIVKGIYCKDIDIKVDFALKKSQSLEIDEYYKDLRDRFNGNADDFHYFKSKKQGFGMGCWDRAKASLKKPFFKFYDKGLELKNKNNIDFYNSLHEDLREEISKHFVWRFEFTIKDNKWCKTYGISNQFIQLVKESQTKWRYIGREYLKKAFEKVRRYIDTSKLTLEQRIWVQMILFLEMKGLSRGAILGVFKGAGLTKQEKYRAGKKGEKLIGLATAPNEWTREALAKVERISKWDRFIGIG